MEGVWARYTMDCQTQTTPLIGGGGINGLKKKKMENDYAHFRDGALGHLGDILYWELVPIMK